MERAAHVQVLLHMTITKAVSSEVYAVISAFWLYPLSITQSLTGIFSPLISVVSYSLVTCTQSSQFLAALLLSCQTNLPGGSSPSRMISCLEEGMITSATFHLPHALTTYLPFCDGKLFNYPQTVSDRKSFPPEVSLLHLVVDYPSYHYLLLELHF